jgi:hypothetical protein
LSCPSNLTRLCYYNDETVVDGLEALTHPRTDAHGTGAAGLRPAARHAELAVNLAGTMATFLLATWESRLR